MSSRFSSSDESSVSRSSSSVHEIDFACEILCNELKKFRGQICQTLQSRFPGYKSLSSIIDAVASDYGFDPVARAKEFGYFSFYEFLASDYMKDRVLISFSENGDAVYQAVPDSESWHIFNEQLIWHLHDKRRKQLLRRRRYNVGKRVNGF